MSTASATLAALARRFDLVATEVRTEAQRKRARRNAQQLRAVALDLHHGRCDTDTAWVWADAAAGQLVRDRGQLATLGRSLR